MGRKGLSERKAMLLHGAIDEPVLFNIPASSLPRITRRGEASFR